VGFGFSEAKELCGQFCIYATRVELISGRMEGARPRAPRGITVSMRTNVILAGGDARPPNVTRTGEILPRLTVFAEPLCSTSDLFHAQ
jgi:hypothetical protein